MELRYSQTLLMSIQGLPDSVRETARFDTVTGRTPGFDKLAKSTVTPVLPIRNGELGGSVGWTTVTTSLVGVLVGVKVGVRVAVDVVVSVGVLVAVLVAVLVGVEVAKAMEMVGPTTPPVTTMPPPEVTETPESVTLAVKVPRPAVVKSVVMM